MTAVGTITTDIADTRATKVNVCTIVDMVRMATANRIGAMAEITIAGWSKDRIVTQVSSVLIAGWRVAALIKQFTGGRVTIDTGIATQVAGGPLVGIRIVTAVGCTGAVEIPGIFVVVIRVADRSIVEVNDSVEVISMTRTSIAVTIGTTTDIAGCDVIRVDRSVFIGAGMVHTVSRVTAITVIGN